MKVNSEYYLGNKPFRYAQKVLKDCGIKKPPVCERTIADYLRLKIREITSGDIREFEEMISDNQEITNYLKNEWAMLRRTSEGRPIIWLYENTRIERKRSHIFHECGHNLLPWHEDLNYFCSGNDLKPTVHKILEREAFGCGAELMMPREMFVEDILSLKTSISAIEQCRHRYVSSMEMTAIRYAFAHPGLCGLVMVEQTIDRIQKSERNDHSLHGQLPFPFSLTQYWPKLTDKKRYPLTVKYFVKSHRFPKFIWPGTGIDGKNLIFEAWISHRRMEGEIPVSTFGGSGKWAYNAECLPSGNTGLLIVLLWLPDYQTKLEFKNGVIL